MLVFATYKGIYPYLNRGVNDKNLVILNFTSFIEAFPRVNLVLGNELNPYFAFNDKDFDVKYYEYIMSNTYTFMELTRIIMPLYYGKNVIILVSDDVENDVLSESLQKMIQQRYGILSYNVYDQEDISELNVDKSSFSIQGIYNLDIDKKRYSTIMENSCTDFQLEKMTKALNDNSEY